MAKTSAVYRSSLIRLREAAPTVCSDLACRAADVSHISS